MKIISKNTKTSNFYGHQLFESQEVPSNQELNMLQTVLRSKAKQFEFDCGVSMAKINVQIDSKFGLAWHYNNTSSFEEFLGSISRFISTSGNKLTKNDITKLKQQYGK